MNERRGPHARPNENLQSSSGQKKPPACSPQPAPAAGAHRTATLEEAEAMLEAHPEIRASLRLVVPDGEVIPLPYIPKTERYRKAPKQPQ